MPRADNVMRVLTFFLLVSSPSKSFAAFFFITSQDEQAQKNNSAREVQFQATPRKSFFPSNFHTSVFLWLDIHDDELPGDAFRCRGCSINGRGAKQINSTI